ncbi:MAG: DUF3341 domain-containing protein [Deltaproteobacteria bacterium]|nr:DUF3341 domain-containing protein [Deltaproteobacteria bacterium]
MKKAVVCIVKTTPQAENIVQELQKVGFADEQISVLFPDTGGSHSFAHEHHTKAPEGAVAGVAGGGLVGGAVGLLAGLGLIAIPGLGPLLLAAGPVIAALSGAAVGAAGAGLVGGLVGLGFPEIEAKQYAGKISGGNILVSAHTDTADLMKRAEKIFKAAGATDIMRIGEAPVPRDARI